MLDNIPSFVTSVMARFQSKRLSLHAFLISSTMKLVSLLRFGAIIGIEVKTQLTELPSLPPLDGGVVLFGNMR